MTGSATGPGREAGAATVALPFAVIVLAMLPAVLDQTILATALPTIAADLGRLTDVSWVVTAYVVAAAAATPLWGKLGDRHGRKRLLQIALALFVAVSALCAAAQGIGELVALRFVQGAAAGGLMTLAMAGWATSWLRASAAATRATSRRPSPSPRSLGRSWEAG